MSPRQRISINTGGISSALPVGSARAISEWAAGLANLPHTATFFNFTASHDGIGVRPVEGILTRAQVAALAERVRARGGLVSVKSDVGGGESPYELNVSLFDALSEPTAPEEDGVRRLLAAAPAHLRPGGLLVVEVGTAALDGLSVNLQVAADGTTNWDDLAEGGDAGADDGQRARPHGRAGRNADLEGGVQGKRVDFVVRHIIK